MSEDHQNKMMNEEAIPTNNLPEVVIEDILSRLPVKSLLRFKCVSKPWCALITDPSFVKKHLIRSLARNSNLSLIFQISSSTSDLNLIFRNLCSKSFDRGLLFGNSGLYSVDLESCEPQVAVKLDHPLKSTNQETLIIGSCNGLLCMYNTEEDIFLWNPSTKRHQKLPSPVESTESVRTYCFIGYGFGYDTTTDDYKLLRIVHYYQRDHSWQSEVKVYSLGTNSWRRIESMSFRLIQHQSGVFVNSALHWVAKREMEPDITFILSFDLKDEECREVPLPEFVDDYKFQLGVLGGQLCVFYVSIFHTEIWVMKDYGVRKSWKKDFSVERSSMSFMYIRPICYSKNGEVVLEKDKEALVVYDPRTGRTKNLRIHGVPYTTETETCVGSLVPLNAKDET